MSTGRPTSEGRGTRPTTPVAADGPRRVRNGIRLRSRDGNVVSTPLVDTLVRLLGSLAGLDELEEGRRYARLGQLRAWSIEPGAIVASVQGRRAEPHRARLELGEFSDDQWDRIVGEMAGEAVYMVKLLADELPDVLDQRLREFGLSLVPEDAASVRASCDCDRAPTCRHVAAAGWILADTLSREPLRIFAVRGIPADRLLERLRQARALRAHGMVAAHVDPLIPEAQDEALPIEACVDDFWRPAASINPPGDVPPSHHVPHALLRRLGPSPLAGKFPLSGLLASIYDTVTAHAERLRDRVTNGEDPPPDR